MGLGGVAIAVLPSMIYPKQPFSDGLGGDFKMPKNNKALQVKTCKAYVMRFKMGLNQRPPD